MQRFWAVTVGVVCLGVAGCSRSASERLVGKWKYDVTKAAKEAIQKKEGPGSAKGILLGVAEAVGVKMEMEIEFKADQTMTMSASLLGTKTSRPIHWKVVQADGNTVTVEISWPSGQNATRLPITFIDQDHIRLAPPAAGGKSLVFTRVKQE